MLVLNKMGYYLCGFYVNKSQVYKGYTIAAPHPTNKMVFVLLLRKSFLKANLYIEIKMYYNRVVPKHQEVYNKIVFYDRIKYC